ncbi:MAG TPA: class I SAM-dependent methyltransferase [Gaiellaceae bacterium]
MSRLDDPEVVREQYSNERGLRARAALWQEMSGPDIKEALWQAITDRAPERVLEVGGGEGWLSQRIAAELGANVVMVDQSERMVELARERGVAAQVGDVQLLSFEDETFDVVVAAWMLYHVTDLDRGLAEIARVLRPGGCLIAVTNSIRHAKELCDRIGYPWQERQWTFRSENGDEALRRHFRDVSRIDLEAWATVRDRQILVDYRDSMLVETTPVPDDLELPLRVGARTTLFVAAK